MSVGKMFYSLINRDPAIVIASKPTFRCLNPNLASVILRDNAVTTQMASITKITLLNCELCDNVVTRSIGTPVITVTLMFVESKRWSHIAWNQPTWSSFNSQLNPRSHAEDDDVTTSGETDSVPIPFLAVDLGRNVPIGFVSLRFAGGT